MNEVTMTSITHPPAPEAHSYLEEMSFNEELCMAAERRKQAQADINDMIDYARDEGEKIGLKKGELIGVEKGYRLGFENGMHEAARKMRRTLLDMMHDKFGTVSAEDIARVMRSDLDTLQTWFPKLLGASNSKDLLT